MLDIAKNNIISKNPNLIERFEFIKLNSQKLPFHESSYDFIVLNSVLHHLPNIGEFYKECYRVLKKGRYLIIGHEPNKYFYESKYSLPYKTISKILTTLGNFRDKILKKETINNAKVNYINQVLFSKKLIKSPLTTREISYLVDFHANKGLEFNKFPKDKFKLIYSFTYSYMSTLNYTYDNKIFNILIKYIDNILKKLDKQNKHGGNYFAIYKKI